MAEPKVGDALHRAFRRELTRTTGEIRTCWWCGQGLKTHPRHRNHIAKRYCGTDCRMKFHKQARSWVLDQVERGKINAAIIRHFKR